MNGDAELLRHYAEASSEAAFAEFVGRHVDMVYYAALRQLGGDAHRAKDVTQLVFTDLARKAGAVCGHPAIVSWLHKSTRYAAAKVRRAEQTRQKYEREAETMNALQRENELPAEWERLGPLVDDALHELNERDREAVLLRFFEGRSFAEVGAALALGENAAHMRVERALDKLHRVLTRKGVTSTAAALATALGSQAVATAPAGLATSVTAAALGAAAAGTGTLAAIWYFLSMSKVGVSLAAAGALAGVAAVHQTIQANTARIELADIRRDQAVFAQRLADLEASISVAEKEKTAREAALEQARLARAAASAAAARRAAADAEKAAQQRALQQFLLADPELRRLRIEANRAAIKADLSVGPQKLTREQIEQRATAYAENKEIQVAQLAMGIDSGIIKVAESWDPSQLVRELSNALFYADDPFTKEQVARLQAILTAAKIPTEARQSRAGLFDWDRVLKEAEPILSPAQLQGLHGMAARGRNSQLLAAVAKESGASP